MKVIYTFDLNDYNDDKEKLAIYQKAPEMHSVIWDFTHNTKQRLNALPEAQAEGYQKALDDFFELMHDLNLRCE